MTACAPRCTVGQLLAGALLGQLVPWLTGSEWLHGNHAAYAFTELGVCVRGGCTTVVPEFDSQHFHRRLSHIPDLFVALAVGLQGMTVQ